MVCQPQVADPQRAAELLSARLRLAERAQQGTLDEVLQLTLDEAERLTGGAIGFFHFLHEDGRTLSLQSWSRNTVARMCSAEGKGSHYAIDQAGVWVDCVRLGQPVIHNDYEGLAHRRGLPPGHARIMRELLVPVWRGGRIVAILGTGNKPTDYDERDVEAVSQLANLAWDIVLHKRADEALEQQKHDLARAQAVAHVGSWRLDLGDHRLSWSDEVYRIFGRDPEAFAPTLEGFALCIHPEDRERVLAAYRRAVEAGTPYEVVHRVLRPSGEVRVVRERSEEIRDEHGVAIRSLGTVLDITELAGAQEELRALNASLEERVRERTAALEASRSELAHLNEQKNRLLGMAAHDLRNPLAAIQAFAELLEAADLGALTPKQLEVLRRIRSSSEHMLKLVNDLLDISKIEAGRLELERVPQDLVTVTREAVATCQLLASPKRITVELVAADEVPMVSLDRTRIEQVLSNLIGNAIKFSHPGSAVEVSVRRRGSEAQLCVRDHGRGIAPERLSTLFHEFATDGRPGTGGERATGLGLAIARRMVEAHGGRIWVTSDPGAGSCFCVALPLDDRGSRPPSS